MSLACPVHKSVPNVRLQLTHTLLFSCLMAGKRQVRMQMRWTVSSSIWPYLCEESMAPCVISPKRSRQAKHLRTLSQGICLQVCFWPANWKTHHVYSPTFVFLLIFCTASHHYSFWRFLILSRANSWRLPVWFYHCWAIFQSSKVLWVSVYAYIHIYGEKEICLYIWKSIKAKKLGRDFFQSYAFTLFSVRADFFYFNFFSSCPGLLYCRFM